MASIKEGFDFSTGSRPVLVAHVLPFNGYNVRGSKTDGWTPCNVEVNHSWSYNSNSS